MAQSLALLVLVLVGDLRVRRHYRLARVLPAGRDVASRRPPPRPRQHRGNRPGAQTSLSCNVKRQIPRLVDAGTLENVSSRATAGAGCEDEPSI